jgi:hypothetical protein
MVQNGTLSPKKRLAIACLLTERTITAAAKAAGVGRQTLNTWLTDPDFRAELTKAETSAIDESVRALVRATNQAIDLLQSVIVDPAASQSVKVRAAAEILNNLMKLREHLSLDERISRLEAAQRERER